MNLPLRVFLESERKRGTPVPCVSGSPGDHVQACKLHAATSHVGRFFRKKWAQLALKRRQIDDRENVRAEWVGKGGPGTRGLGGLDESGGRAEELNNQKNGNQSTP